MNWRTFMWSAMIQAKFWLEPARLEWSSGFSRKEINSIQSLVEQHQQQILERWNEFFHG